MENKDYTRHSAQAVLNEINLALVELEPRWQGERRSYKISDVYDRFSIFDWWPERLNRSHLRDMKMFIETAIQLGYTGYVCFKVGARGCANGMWAHKKDSTNGYSPDGPTIYKSFTPAYNYWSFTTDEAGEDYWPEADNYDKLTTKSKFLEEYHKVMKDKTV